MNGATPRYHGAKCRICDAALREGEAYAKDRKQFGQAINRFPAVYEMLAMMRAKNRCGTRFALRNLPFRRYVQNLR